MALQTYRLMIGDKAYSSWSLRPWLLMRQVGLAFEEVRVRLRRPESKTEIEQHSPSGKVPALLVGDRVVWDSLAILEFLAERHPELGIWPAEAAARAEARSVSAEMHAGFQALRSEMPMDFLARQPDGRTSDAVEADIRRIVCIWTGLRRRHAAAGPFLFGAFSAADAMYAPVVSRFTTYGVDTSSFGDDGEATRYADTVMRLPALVAWGEGAAEEIAASEPA